MGSEKRKVSLTSDEVRQVRGHFFNFFCQLFKYFKIGVKTSDWKKFGQQQKPEI